LFCHLNIWAFHIGWAVFFLPLLLKTYRLLQVFTAAKHMKRKTVSTKLLLGVLTAWIICVEVLISALWSGILNPRGDSTYMTDATDPSLLREYKVCQSTPDGTLTSVTTDSEDSASTYGQVSSVYRSASVSANSAYAPLVAISSAANGVLVFAGVVLAIRTRNISSKFSESSQQAAMMYNSGVFTALVAVFFLLPAASPHASARAQVGCMMLSLTLNLLILFVPKLFDLSDSEMSNMSNSIANKNGTRKKGPASLDKKRQSHSSSTEDRDSALTVSSKEPKSIELTSTGIQAQATCPTPPSGVEASSTEAYTSAVKSTASGNTVLSM
jgi:hypothetical protein